MDGHQYQVSPLLNHVVVEKVFSFLDFPQWKSCRLVCSTWNRVALKSKLEKVSVVILEDYNLLAFLTSLQRQEVEPNDHDIIKHAFHNYRLCVDSCLTQNESLPLLWIAIGRNLRTLRLELTTLCALENLPDLLLEQTPLLEEVSIVVTEYWGNKRPPTSPEEMRKDLFQVQPNWNMKNFRYSYLGSLSLYGMGNQEEFSFPLDWNSFFSRFPAIQRLSFVGLSELELTQMLTALESSSHPQPCLKLTHLELLDENMCPEAPNNAHVQLLSNLHLPLTELHLEVSPTLSIPLLQGLLTQLAPTLQSLRLRRFPLVFLTEVQLGLNLPMSHVTFLEISNELLPSLEFLPFLPNLRTLNVILRDYRSLPPCEIIANTPPTLGPHPCLQDIFIEAPLVSEDCILSLGRIVPHLKSLKLRLNDELLWALCGSPTISQSLEELEIVSHGGLTDEGFTGISEDGWNHLGRNLSARESEQVRQFRIYPFIGDLINLRRLRVEMWSDYSNHVTDKAVLFGILDLKKLSEFHGIRLQLSQHTTRLLSERLHDRCIIHE